MPSFFKGLLTGAAVGVITGLVTSKRSGAENRHTLTKLVTDTSADLKTISSANARLQESTSALQEALTTSLEPALAGIEKSMRHYEFTTEPHKAKIAASLARIQAVLPSEDNLK